MESILTSIKKLLGIAEDYEHFDTDIIMHINSVFMTLNQLGVGPNKPAVITNHLATWKDALGDTANIEAVKIYVYLKVRMVFDPPTSSFVLEAMSRQANELEWRLNVQAEESEDSDA